MVIKQATEQDFAMAVFPDILDVRFDLLWV